MKEKGKAPRRNPLNCPVILLAWLAEGLVCHNGKPSMVSKSRDFPCIDSQDLEASCALCLSGKKDNEALAVYSPLLPACVCGGWGGGGGGGDVPTLGVPHCGPVDKVILLFGGLY